MTADKKSTRSKWIRRRWFDFRQGHSTYLIFAMSFIQFVIISYTLAVERFSILEQIFPAMWMWATFFILAYVPAAVFVGYAHRKFQMPTETEQTALASPYTKHVHPGKEQLFHLPMSLLSIDTNIMGMELQNKQAEAIEILAKNLGVEIQLPRIPESKIDLFRKWRVATERLIEGDNVEQIVADLGLTLKK